MTVVKLCYLCLETRKFFLTLKEIKENERNRFIFLAKSRTIKGVGQILRIFWWHRRISIHDRRQKSGKQQ